MAVREVRLGRKPPRKCGEEAHEVSRYKIYCFLGGDTKLCTSQDVRRSSRTVYWDVCSVEVVSNMRDYISINRTNVLQTTTTVTIGYGSPNSVLNAVGLLFPV